MRDYEPMLDGPLELPDRTGFEAVLEAEEQRARRHGGLHGLVLVELDRAPDDSVQVEAVAVALAECLRETDLLARIDDNTFGVLAVHCHDLDSLVSRLRLTLASLGFPLVASVRSRSGGTHLRATWTAIVSGAEAPTAPAQPSGGYAPFVALLPPSMN